MVVQNDTIQKERAELKAKGKYSRLYKTTAHSASEPDLQIHSSLLLDESAGIATPRALSHSLSHVLQQGLAIDLVVVIDPKIHSLDPLLLHVRHQTAHFGPFGRIIDLQRTVTPELCWDLADDGPALVVGQGILEFNNGVRVGEELRRSAVSRVEHHVGGWLHARSRVRCHGFVVRVHGAGHADIVEVDAPNGDVCIGIVGPAGVHIGFAVHLRDGLVSVDRVYVPDRFDVGIAVQLCDAADEVG